MKNKSKKMETITGVQGFTRRELLAASAGAILASGASAVADSVTAIMEEENNSGTSAMTRPQPDHSHTFYIMPIWER